MRRRRAQRCRLRAQVAIEAGCLDDASVALEEARTLEPASSDLDVLNEALAAARAVPPPDAVAYVWWPRPLRISRRFGAMAAGIAALALGTWAVSGNSAPAQAVAVSQPPMAVEQTTGTLPEPSASPVDAQPAPREERVRVEERETVPARVVPEPPAIAAPATPEPDPDIDPAILKRTLPAPPPASSPALPIVTIAEPPASAPPPPPSSPAPPVADANPADVESASGSMRVNETARVRSVLSRYEAAYSALDAGAARAIWPKVDASALERAFGNLESQRVSLGSCSVNVDGAAARATCFGSATWVPKVGGGATTEPRRWTFELRQVAGEWQISEAFVR